MIKLSTRIIANKNNHNDPLKSALQFPSHNVSAGVWLLLSPMQKIQVLTIFFCYCLIIRFIKWKRITRKRKETKEKHGKETYLKYV